MESPEGSLLSMLRSQKKTLSFSLLLVLLAVVFFAFSPSLKNQFVNWDDPTHFLDLKHIRAFTIPNLKQIFSEHINATYIPLTTLSFALEYHFVQYNSFIYHLDNILLHLLVVILVFSFLKRMGLSFLAAGLGAFLFGIHPMRVESIAWVTERKDVLYASLYLLALHSYLSFIQTKKKRFYVLTFLLGLLSILAKPMALSLPLILLLMDWYFGRTDWKRNILEKLPFFAYVIFLARLTQSQNTDAFAIDQSLFHSTLIFVWTFSAYLLKFLFPVTLTPLYQLPEPISLANTHYLGAIVVFISFFALLWKLRRQKLFLFSILFYLLSMFFLLRINKIYNVDVIADRFIYLPSLGFCLLFGIAIEKVWRLPKWKTLAIGGVIIIFSSLIYKTYHQNMIWKDSLTLWNHVLKHEPRVAFAYNNRGIYYEEHGQFDLALSDYNETIKILPTYIKTYIHRGIIYGKKGEYDLALKDLSRVIASRPDDWAALNNRGNIYQIQEKYELAIADYEQSIRINPNVETTFDNRGASYSELGRYDLALKDFDQAIALNPEYTNAYVNRGLVMDKMKKHSDAFANYNKALILDQTFLKAWVRRAALQKELGNLDEAIADYSQAIALKPDYSEIYNNRGVIYGMKGEYDKAFNDLNRAIELNPQNANAYLNRAVVYKLKGSMDKAGQDTYRAQVLFHQQKK
jgi:tetratricopeptide (TPR) repeat protein